MFARISRSSGQRRCPQDAIVRWFAASKKNVIDTRTMQKQLFGQPIDVNNTKRFIPKTGHSANSRLDDSSNKAGEIYWMGLRSKHVKTFSADSSTAKTSPVNGNTPDVRDVSTAKAKLPTEHGVPDRWKNVSIPFDDDQLQTIPTYAMNCVKADISLVDGLLADKSKRLPSVSRILQATMSDGARAALKRWKLQKIDELGYDGFQLYQQEILSTGKHFHSVLERYLGTGEVPESTSPAIKLWQSLGDHLAELNPKAILIEKPIIHPYLKYQGIIDNVSLINGEVCALEWKTSEKPKQQLSSMFDAPVQLCAYLGALNSDPRYNLTISNGFVVVAYKNGDKGNVFRLSNKQLQPYWQKWLQRVQEYWIRVRDNTLPEPI